MPMKEITTSLVSDLTFDVIAEQIETSHMSEEFTWHCEFIYKGKCYEGIIEACAVDPKEIHADKITNIEEKKFTYGEIKDSIKDSEVVEQDGCWATHLVAFTYEGKGYTGTIQSDPDLNGTIYDDEAIEYPEINSK